MYGILDSMKMTQPNYIQVIYFLYLLVMMYSHTLWIRLIAYARTPLS